MDMPFSMPSKLLALLFAHLGGTEFIVSADRRFLRSRLLLYCCMIGMR